MICPYCLKRDVGHECNSCGASIVRKRGVPSVIDRDSRDEAEQRLWVLADEKRPLEERLDAVRDDYMDGRVIDRFFKTRTVCWRFLVPSALTGRGLVIGNHEEKVGLLLAEVLEEVHVVDDSLARLRALEAVADSQGVEVCPLHGTLETLPYPQDAFDVIVLQCRANEVTTYLSELRSLLTDGGSVLLLIDGWPRELGLTHPFGLGAPEGTIADRVRSVPHGFSWRISRNVRNSGLEVANRYALLSTNRHENERAFDVEDQAGLEWLLYGSDKTASTTPFVVARQLSRAVQKTGLLRQCYPRYLFVCQPMVGVSESLPEEEKPKDAILVSGKNRATVLELESKGIASVQKLPNSTRQGELNENAHSVTENGTGPLCETVPESELVRTKFGPERHEQPVDGTPMDESLEPTPESVDRHLKIIFDWLIEFQTANTVRWVENDPAEIESNLSVDSVGLSTPPNVDQPIELPLVPSHGDLFGSNIYLDQEKVVNVIDWEWAKMNSNPMVDSGFLLLQTADRLGNGFEQGFSKLLIKESDYSQIIYRIIEEYCTRIGIEPSTFVTHLPVSYVQRIAADMTFNKRLDIDWADRVRYVWKQQDKLRSRIENY